MACILRGFDRNAECWGQIFRDVLTLEQVPQDCLSVPQNEWHCWTVTDLQSEQCRVAAQHAYQDANWERIKSVVFAIGGAVATVAALALMTIVAGEVLILADLLMQGAAFLGVAMFGESIAFMVSLILGASFSLAWAFGQILFASAALIVGIWTKVFLPALNNSIAYTGQLVTQARELEIAGARVVN
jgi:hypothetical protein